MRRRKIKLTLIKPAELFRNRELSCGGSAKQMFSSFMLLCTLYLIASSQPSSCRLRMPRRQKYSIDGFYHKFLGQTNGLLSIVFWGRWQKWLTHMLLRFVSFSFCDDNSNFDFRWKQINGVAKDIEPPRSLVTICTGLISSSSAWPPVIRWIQKLSCPPTRGVPSRQKWISYSFLLALWSTLIHIS